MSRPVVFWIAATAILGLGLFWRLESLDRRPLWLDEVSTAAVVRESPTLAALWSHGAGDQFLHPPLAYLGNWLADPDGAAPARLRMPSLVAGVASIALLIALGTRVLGPVGGLLAGFLLAISMHHVDHSQEARPYMPSLALTLGMYTALFAYLDRRRALLLAAFVACAALALYTFHLALLHVAVAGGIAALDLLLTARNDRGLALRRLRPLAVAGAALVLLYLPQVGNLRGFLAGTGAVPNHVLDLSPAVLDVIADRWVSGPAWATRLCEIAFAIGAVALARRRDATAAGIAVWLMAPFLLFGLLPFSKYFDLRFLISSLPAFFLVIAAGIDAAARAAARLAPGRRAPELHAAAALAVAVLLYVPAARLYTVFRDSERRCGDFVRDRAVFYANDRLCADHLLLNTIHVDHQFVLRKLGRFVAVPAERLDGCAGRYVFPDETPIVIERHGDQLVAQIGRRFPFALVAESEDAFASRIDARRLRFERGADGRATAVALTTKVGEGRALRSDASP